MKIFKWLRIFFASILFALLLFLFVDISASETSLLLHYLAEIQFVPLLLSGGIIGVTGVALWILATLIFGRCYCSLICPFGILQDIISRLARLVRRKKHKYSYHPPMRKTRILILVLFFVGLFLMFRFGISTFVILLEPYSNFGRISVSILQPVTISVNNLIVRICDLTGFNAGFQLRGIEFFGVAFIISLAMFLVVIFFSFFYGRRYCNTICPVGTLLGLFSRAALFHVKIDQSKCVKCGLCERVCKSECIDSKNYAVDLSRCVTCFNCFNSCRKGAILYSSDLFAGAKISNVDVNSVAKFGAVADISERRRFLRLTFFSFIFSLFGGGAMNPDDPYNNNDSYGKDSYGGENVGDNIVDTKLVDPKLSSGAGETISGTSELVESNNVVNKADSALDIADKASRVSYVNDSIVLPPGARSLQNFRSKCTSCHLCVSKCPSRVLQPGGNGKAGGSGDGGIFGLTQPSLQFDHHYCNRNCTVCGDVCPTNAIEQVTTVERELLKIGTVEFLIDNCIVYTQGTSCGACQEHCSNGAIKMIPYGDPSKNLTIPEIHTEFCIGCGGCESICPVRPYRAIYIKGETKQTNAKLSYDPNEKQKTVELDFI
ncbi:MAG: 4Fe-4S dicluster domain-containing protein [Planctomycetaceae bacterium]|jgi:ferredoxin|nr:4Fe-4S dicluster domain-containing protein [Planctomycetaceae bacterium]